MLTSSMPCAALSPRNWVASLVLGLFPDTQEKTDTPREDRDAARLQNQNASATQRAALAAALRQLVTSTAPHFCTNGRVWSSAKPAALSTNSWQEINHEEAQVP